LWTLLAGMGLGAVGGGMTLPFLLVYLHRDRGLSLSLAATVLTCLAAAGVPGNAVAGMFADRLGARITLIAGLTATGIGAVAVALADGGTAFAAAALLGLATGIVVPSQDALLAGLAGPAERAAAFGACHAATNVGLAVGGLVGAGVAGAFGQHLSVLFVLQALVVAVYAWIVRSLPETVAVPAADKRAAEAAGYRAVFGDRALRGLLLLVALLFGAGYAQYNAALPAFATGPAGLATAAVGIAVAANAIAVVAAQLFSLRLVARKRRSRALAAAAAVWAIGWLVVLGAGQVGGQTAGIPLLAAGAAVLGLGETLLSPTLMPLVNDLAPVALRGRYNGACALACNGGWVLGPLLAGAAFTNHTGSAFVLGLAVVCALASLGALRLERRLPVAANGPLPSRAADLIGVAA
jgi:MFS family permease